MPADTHQIVAPRDNSHQLAVRHHADEPNAWLSQNDLFARTQALTRSAQHRDTFMDNC
jgi:hypothetical protein